MRIRESLGLKDEFLVVHSGNMGVKQGLAVILGAAELSRGDSSIQYLLVGNGAERERLQAQARAMRLENVQFFPLLPDEEYGELLATANISLVTQQKCVADIVFPSKIITLMASGQVIVASVNHSSEVARLLASATAGLVVPPEDSVSLFAAIIALRGDGGLRRKMAHNAREFARQNWNKDIVLGQMETQLRALIAANGTRATQSRWAWSVFRSKIRRVVV